MKKFVKSKIFIYSLLILMITAQLSYIFYIFTFQKEGFHSDEMYSYGLANSHRNPFLSIDGYVFSEKYINVDKWIPGSVMNDYIVVNDGENFDYKNVWYNQSLDRHPPFYYSVLHTICSFFPNQFSPYFGFFVNAVVFVVTQIFLFLLARKLLKSNWLAILICLCYGFSTGAIDTFIYIRMYAMITMWAVILAYLHANLFNKKDKLKIISLIPITIIVTLGALTQHEFTIVAFIFAVCFCIYYLFRKQFKNFFKYGCSMAFGVLLAWIIFPPLFNQIFTETGNNVSFETFLQQIKLSFKFIAADIWGIYTSPGDLVYISIVIPTFIILVLIFLIPICFLFRKNKKLISAKDSLIVSFKKFMKKVKAFTIIKFLKTIFTHMRQINCVYISMLLSVFTVIAITSHAENFFSMGYCNRYIFIVYPFIVLILIALFGWILAKFKCFKTSKTRNIIVSFFFILFLLNNILNTRPQFLFEGAKNLGDLSVITSNCECIILQKGKGSQYRLVCFSDKLRNAAHVFQTDYDNLRNVQQELDSLKTDRPVYIFLLTDNHKEEKNIYKFSLKVNGENYEELYEDELLNKYFSALNFYSSPERLGIVKIYCYNYVVYRMV